ncbi:hypothetical protein ZWY2020_022299 [Hordeum vulgare]|nr:hypothetical protein ZWY2020_022299 [Hordeum vulgare]
MDRERSEEAADAAYVPAMKVDAGSRTGAAGVAPDAAAHDELGRVQVEAADAVADDAASAHSTAASRREARRTPLPAGWGVSESESESGRVEWSGGLRLRRVEVGNNGRVGPLSGVGDPRNAR